MKNGLKTIARFCLLLLAVSAVSFFLVSLSPVDPLRTNVGQTALGSLSPEQVEKLKSYWGVGIPAGRRFLTWLSGLLQGDFGVSLLYRRPVLEVIGEKFLNSLWLMLSAWLIAGVLGTALGILAGMRRGRWQDKAVTAYCMVIAGTPAFWLALLLLLLFAVRFPIFPIGFSVPIGMEAASVSLSDRIAHAALPALTLSLTGVSSLAMQTRTKLIEVLESDYVLYARAMGESEWAIIRRHGLRNILLPVITLQFSSISEIFGGSVLVEQVFSYPGLGQASITAGLGSDVPLLLGITLISAAIVFMGNFAADLLYASVDPRMRRSAAGRRERRRRIAGWNGAGPGRRKESDLGNEIAPGKEAGREMEGRREREPDLGEKSGGREERMPDEAKER